MNKRLVKIGEAAKLLGTTPATLRSWEKTGEVVPTRKTDGGTRYYDVADLQVFDKEGLTARRTNSNTRIVQQIKTLLEKIT